MNKVKITIVGAGYVGMSLAVLLAKHHEIKVLDIDEEKVQMINAKKSPLADKDIKEAFKKEDLNLFATADSLDAFVEADYIIIATPTHFEEETQIGITFPKHLESKILNTLFANHPYEEVAYEVTTLENTNQHIGIGMIGELETAQNPIEFLKFVKERMQTGCVRHSKLIDKKIKKVAVLGGSGAFAIPNAVMAGADIYITGDVKYHDFYKAENKIIIADIGHYETEQFTKNLLVEYLTKKFTNFAVVLSVCNTNPVKYL